MPRPPLASDTPMPSTPISARSDHTLATRSASARAPSPLRAPWASVPSGQAARTTSGGHSLARRSATASRKASWSSVKAKRMSSLLPRQAEHALGRDVALDLVGARVDRAGEGELPALAPGPVELGLGTEDVEGGLV